MTIGFEHGLVYDCSWDHLNAANNKLTLQNIRDSNQIVNVGFLSNFHHMMFDLHHILRLQ